MASFESDSENDEEISWHNQLQGSRLILVQYVEYMKLAPSLQSDFIFDREDHEMIRNPYNNPTSSAQASMKQYIVYLVCILFYFYCITLGFNILLSGTIKFSLLIKKLLYVKHA